jgi:hypothetical protein
MFKRCHTCWAVAAWDLLAQNKNQLYEVCNAAPVQQWPLQCCAIGQVPLWLQCHAMQCA